MASKEAQGGSDVSSAPTAGVLTWVTLVREHSMQRKNLIYGSGK